MGVSYFELQQYDKAIPNFEKVLAIYDEWGTKPIWVYLYLPLGFSYIKTGDFKKAKSLFKKAEQDFPDYIELMSLQSILSLAERDTISANKNIKKCISALKDRSFSKTVIKSVLAGYYNEAGIPDVAEKYKREALSLEPENPDLINNLAYFLINNDQDVNEGLGLIDRALEANPEFYEYLDTKGWGLYKQGKYTEAKDMLQKSWDLRMKNARYSHEAYLHLEAAKKSAAGQI